MHLISLSFSNKWEFEPNQTFSHVFWIRFVHFILHHCVECISLKETSCKRLNLRTFSNQVSSLALNKRLTIIVCFTTERTCFFTFLLLNKFFKWVKTRFMKYMTTRKYSLFWEIQVFTTDCTLNLTPFLLYFLNLLPLILWKWFSGFFK